MRLIAALTDESSIRHYLTGVGKGRAVGWRQARVPLRGRSFEADGSLLSPLDFEGSKVAFAAGLKFNVQSAHSEVTVYGDTAILTEYHMRQLTPQVKPLSA